MMFNQLRKRFLVLHLVITTITVLLAFSVIYVIIHQYSFLDIRKELDKIGNSIRIINLNDPDYLMREFPAFPEVDHLSESGLIISLNRTPENNEHAVSFFILLDSQDQVLDQVSNYYGVDSKLYQKATQTILRQDQDFGSFQFKGYSWAYVQKKFYPDYTCFVVMNVTTQMMVLKHLVYTSLLVTIGVLIAIYFISRYFANRSIAPVKVAFEKQKQFVSDASHELKTPLTSINANIDVVLSNPESLVKEQSKWLNYIQSETKRMTKLTNDLLYLSRMGNQELQASFVPVDLSELVANTVMVMEAVIFEKGFCFASEITPQIWLNGNQEQLNQLILILMDNAVKYTNPGGNISIKLENKDNLIVLEIKNSGEGIPQEHLPHVFDRFYRPDNSRERKSGGYGLGLAIAKTITEAHGGNIQAFSMEKEYTLFRVTWKKFKHHSAAEKI